MCGQAVVNFLSAETVDCDIGLHLAVHWLGSSFNSNWSKDNMNG